MSTSLNHVVLTKDRDISSTYFEPFIQQIRNLHPTNILAILAYGSTLNQTTISETSTPDFYVVVNDYDQFYQKPFHRFLNRHLPPNIYHTNVGYMRYKYCVISLEHLRKEVSARTKDAYHLGRFSKRLGIVWDYDENIQMQIVTAQIEAHKTVALKVLQSLDTDFMLDDFIYRCLFLSYQGDVRIEAKDKIQKIMESEKDYYTTIYTHILADLGLKENLPDTYVLKKSFLKKSWDQMKFQRFIRSSRIRARLRWPKNMITVENWVDYMTAKIERTQGIKIELTPTEKKYWYIFGWKHFLRLYRKNLIK
jgi:hypothetical protein